MVTGEPVKVARGLCVAGELDSERGEHLLGDHLEIDRGEHNI
jgi:hypothetical protein